MRITSLVDEEATYASHLKHEDHYVLGRPRPQDYCVALCREVGDTAWSPLQLGGMKSLLGRHGDDWKCMADPVGKGRADNEIHIEEGHAQGLLVPQSSV